MGKAVEAWRAEIIYYMRQLKILNNYHIEYGDKILERWDNLQVYAKVYPDVHKEYEELEDLELEDSELSEEDESMIKQIRELAEFNKIEIPEVKKKEREDLSALRKHGKDIS